jgi:hypothetical protein
MSWHSHRLIPRINDNTCRGAAASEGVFDEQRLAQLEGAGLIDFNAPADVVRALERRLAVQRGEPVRRTPDPTICRQMALGSSVAAAVGLLFGGQPVGFVGSWGFVVPAPRCSDSPS